MAEKAGCSQHAVSKYIHGKLTRKEKCDTKRCTSKRNDLRGLSNKSNSRSWGSASQGVN